MRDARDDDFSQLLGGSREDRKRKHGEEEEDKHFEGGRREGGMLSGGKGTLPRPPIVGDGGASWRMKALKRAQEQAAREGRKLDEVVEDRWGSLASLTSSVAHQRAAHSHAHLHARRDRQDIKVTKASKDAETKEETEKAPGEGEDDDDDKRIRTDRRDYLKDAKAKDNRMRAPHADRTLSWKNKGRGIRPEDAEVLRAAASTYNQFSNDGNFLRNIKTTGAQGNSDVSTRVSAVYKSSTKVETVRSVKGTQSRVDNVSHVGNTTKLVTKVEVHSTKEDAKASSQRSADEFASTSNEESISRPEYQSVSRNSGGEPSSRAEATDEQKSVGSGVQFEGLSSNQIAAKVMQLRLRGKQKEADELQRQGEAVAKVAVELVTVVEDEETASRPSQILARLEALGKKTLESRRESADRSLAGAISHNKLYKAEDEYDDLGPQAEKKKKKAQGGKERPTIQSYNRIQTQQERCKLCFDNADRPKHLTMAIANYTYLSLPPRCPLVHGHCYIVPMQHEGATRNVDDAVWEELRNFKKCLVRMFDAQGKEAIFLETAMHLSRQKRHCVVECIPISASYAKEAPLYFKKAIDEAESEWSVHNAKKLIDTRIKGLRSSVPKNFPYFHVEFGMNGGGYAHVIDDESKFDPEFGREVVQGMLQMEEEDVNTHAISRREQEKSTKDFLKMWEPHDWTKMLE